MVFSPSEYLDKIGKSIWYSVALTPECFITQQLELNYLTLFNCISWLSVVNCDKYGLFYTNLNVNSNIIFLLPFK